MNSRTAPLTLVAFLALLTVGFAVLGLAMAPNSADLAVHNGTGETFGAPQFTIELTQSAVSAQNTVQTAVQVVDYHAPDRMLFFQGTPTTKLQFTGAAHPATIPAELAHFTTFTEGTINWVRHGSLFDRTSSVLINVSRPGQSAVVRGTLHEIAVIRGGYLVALNRVVDIPGPSGTSARTTGAAASTSSLRLLRVNGGRPPAVGSTAN